MRLIDLIIFSLRLLEFSASNDSFDFFEIGNIGGLFDFFAGTVRFDGVEPVAIGHLAILIGDDFNHVAVLKVLFKRGHFVVN